MFSFFLFLFQYSAYTDTVILKDGDRYYGKIVYEGDGKIHMEMEIGLIKFNRDEVAAISKDSEEEKIQESDVEQDSLPFPRRKKKAPRKKRAPRKKSVPQFVDEPVSKEKVSQDADAKLKSREMELEFKEKELDLKRRELELRRRELELRKRESAPVEKSVPEEKPRRKQRQAVEPEPEELPISEEPMAEELPIDPEPVEEEDWKIKGYPVKPVIKGSGSERYRTY